MFSQVLLNDFKKMSFDQFSRDGLAFFQLVSGFLKAGPN
jgi:hypothetical protein